MFKAQNPRQSEGVKWKGDKNFCCKWTWLNPTWINLADSNSTLRLALSRVTWLRFQFVATSYPRVKWLGLHVLYENPIALMARVAVYIDHADHCLPATKSITWAFIEWTGSPCSHCHPAAPSGCAPKSSTTSTRTSSSCSLRSTTTKSCFSTTTLEGRKPTGLL